MALDEPVYVCPKCQDCGRGLRRIGTSEFWVCDSCDSTFYLSDHPGCE